jgi:hypothetical protein
VETSPGVRSAASAGASSAPSTPHAMPKLAAPSAGSLVTPAAASATERDASAAAQEAPLDYIVSAAGTKIAGELLAAPCVKPSTHAAVTDAGDGGVVMVDAYQDISEDSDLDGDGTNDLVVAGSAARYDVDHWIYLKRGSCGHFVGRIASSNGIEPLKSRTKGLADIKVVTDVCKSLGGLGHGWCEVVWHFDGVKYAPGREKTSARPAQSVP